MYYIKKKNDFLTKNLKFSNTKEHGVCFESEDDAKQFITENKLLGLNIVENEKFNNIDISDIKDKSSVEILETFETLYKKVTCYLDQLVTELSLADKEISDIYHYIEFNNLNAVDGFKIYKRLQEALQKRRKVKDRLAEITSISNLTNMDKIKNSHDVINSNMNRHYNPRVLADLFK